MKDYKEKNLSARRVVNFHSKLVAKDRKLKNLEHTKTFDKDMFNKGYAWFESGLALEDAPVEFRDNYNFVNGFEKAKRVMTINEDLKSLGIEWFNSGLSLEDAPKNYKDNEYFVNGFEYAKSKYIDR